MGPMTETNSLIVLNQADIELLATHCKIDIATLSDEF
jgi:hypothetical protein